MSELVKARQGVELTREGHTWLAALNAGLLADGGQPSLPTAGALIYQQQVLDVEPGLKGAARRLVSVSYGIEKHIPADDYEVWGFDAGLRQLIVLENNFGIDPRVGVAEFGTVDWKAEYKAFGGRIQPSYTPQIHKFFNETWAVAVFVKANQFLDASLEEAERIKEMSPDEWNKYIGGIRWLPGPYADDLVKDATQMREKAVNAAIAPAYAFSIRWEAVHQRFAQFEITQQIIAASEFVKPLSSRMISYNALPYTLESALRPKKTPES